MKPNEMTHTIKVEAIKYIPGTSESQRWASGQRPRVALLFWLDAPEDIGASAASDVEGLVYDSHGKGKLPCYHEMPASHARKLGLVVEGWNSGRNGWFLRGQTIECRVSYYGTTKAFSFDGGPMVKQADGNFTSTKWASYHHAKITRYGTITGGERQTEAHLEEAFAMVVRVADG